MTDRHDTSQRDTALFGEYVSTFYASRNDLTEEGLLKAQRAFGREVGGLLPTDRDAKILEIGCGAGAFLACCNDLGYSHAEGIDVSEEQVAFCRQRGINNVKLASASDYLRGTRDTWAAIVMLDVLEHIQKEAIVPLLESIRDHLEPDGELVLRVPNMSNPLNLRTRYVDFTHEVGFSIESLEQVLRLAGLTPIGIQGTARRHRNPLARWVFDHLLWWAFRVLHKRTFGLSAKVSRGKNLLAVARRSSSPSEQSS